MSDDRADYPRVRWHSEHGPVLETTPGAYTLLTVGVAYRLFEEIARCMRIAAGGHVKWPGNL
jgi:hypothetical protein